MRRQPFLAPMPTLLCREPSRSELERKRRARAAHPGAGARPAHSPKKNVFAAPAQVKRARRNGLAMGHEKACAAVATDPCYCTATASLRTAVPEYERV